MHSRKPNAPRISIRCRLIARPAQSYAYHSSAGTFTRWATYDTAGPGIFPVSSGNRASTSKNFSNSANPAPFAAPGWVRSGEVPWRPWSIRPCPGGKLQVRVV